MTSRGNKHPKRHDAFDPNASRFMNRDSSPLKPFTRAVSAEERETVRPEWMSDPSKLPKSPPKRKS